VIDVRMSVGLYVALSLDWQQHCLEGKTAAIKAKIAELEKELAE